MFNRVGVEKPEQFPNYLTLIRVGMKIGQAQATDRYICFAGISA